MNIDDLAKRFKKMSPGLVLGTVMDAGDSYIVALTKENLPKDAYVMDSTYECMKKDGSIKPFIVGLNTDKYKKALKNIVYKKPQR